MKIVLIGSGNVAWNLGKLFVQKGHRVIQVIGRNKHTCSELAYELDTESANYISIMYPDADLYVLAVNDDSIREIVKELKGFNKRIVHTSGSVSMELLKACSSSYGVLYPLQSLLYGTRTIPEIPFLIQAGDPETKNILSLFAATLSDRVTGVSDENKVAMHIAAVLVNNFTNHLYVLAEKWCSKNRIDFQLLLPLILESANRLKTQSPADLQTGPAVRNDNETIAKHLALLHDDPYLSELYSKLTEGIIKTSGLKH
jgi:predicted short-subunit dehydrogenase-like oxidoreductase (DUF2520 family)